MAEMFVGRVTPPTILWACLHLALSSLLRYHCQNRATTGLLAKVVLLKSKMTSTLSFFYIVTDSPKSHMHSSNYWHSSTGPEHGKWHQNVKPTLSPSQPLLPPNRFWLVMQRLSPLLGRSIMWWDKKFIKMLTSTSRKQMNSIFHCHYCFYYFIILFFFVWKLIFTIFSFNKLFFIPYNQDGERKN